MSKKTGSQKSMLNLIWPRSCKAETRARVSDLGPFCRSDSTHKAEANRLGQDSFAIATTNSKFLITWKRREVFWLEIAERDP